MIQPTPALSYDELLRRAHALWMIIDNIDSADDSAKEDDAAFRRMVMRRVGERHKLFSCDDHDVLHPVFEAAVPQSPPPRPAFTPAWNQIKDIASANGLTAHIEVADTTELRVVLRRPDHYAVDRSAEAGSASPTVDRDLTSPLDRDKAEAGHPRLVDEMFVSRYGGYPISEVRSWPAERVQALARVKGEDAFQLGIVIGVTGIRSAMVVLADGLVAQPVGTVAVFGGEAEGRFQGGDPGGLDIVAERAEVVVVALLHLQRGDEVQAVDIEVLGSDRPGGRRAADGGGACLVGACPSGRQGARPRPAGRLASHGA